MHAGTGSNATHVFTPSSIRNSLGESGLEKKIINAIREYNRIISENIIINAIREHINKLEYNDNDRREYDNECH